MAHLVVGIQLGQDSMQDFTLHLSLFGQEGLFCLWISCRHLKLNLYKHDLILFHLKSDLPGEHPYTASGNVS